MIVIVLRSSRTCHNMNVRLGEILFQSFTVYPRRCQSQGCPATSSDSIQNDRFWPPPRGGQKVVILTPFWGGGAILNNVNFGGFHRSWFKVTPTFRGSGGVKIDLFRPPLERVKIDQKVTFLTPPGRSRIPWVLTGSSQTCEKVMKMTTGEHGVSIMWRNIF